MTGDLPEDDIVFMKGKQAKGNSVRAAGSGVAGAVVNDFPVFHMGFTGM